MQTHSAEKYSLRTYGEYIHMHLQGEVCKVWGGRGGEKRFTTVVLIDNRTTFLNKQTNRQTEQEAMCRMEELQMLPQVA